MANLLETVMLVCFGFSWPMAVIKNYKARSAKAMSLYFSADHHWLCCRYRSEDMRT